MINDELLEKLADYFISEGIQQRTGQPFYNWLWGVVGHEPIE